MYTFCRPTSWSTLQAKQLWRGTASSLYELDVAALCEAEMSEEDAAARNEETVQLEDSEDSATEEEDLGPIDDDPRPEPFFGSACNANAL